MEKVHITEPKEKKRILTDAYKSCFAGHNRLYATKIKPFYTGITKWDVGDFLNGQKTQ